MEISGIDRSSRSTRPTDVLWRYQVLIEVVDLPVYGRIMEISGIDRSSRSTRPTDVLWRYQVLIEVVDLPVLRTYYGDIRY